MNWLSNNNRTMRIIQKMCQRSKQAVTLKKRKNHLRPQHLHRNIGIILAVISHHGRTAVHIQNEGTTNRANHSRVIDRHPHHHQKKQNAHQKKIVISRNRIEIVVINRNRIENTEVKENRRPHHLHRLSIGRRKHIQKKRNPNAIKLGENELKKCSN